ncbi:hypothetical protein T069G_04936 [Trichoderma breve]|uniref:Uncharacterized protein n=1 Tax=Trichoderma breve TaxID=2034170 RepID=A0A9W9BHG4_9HYPO|nr:hypothetical protein T069G_04936 [Trichoderma breve]KAJ4859948.1 hypothetical protein T069G_04936 [Trichoderma breve]
MANKVVLDLDLLRGSTPRGQATYLRNLVKNNADAESSITPQLIALVASDSLPSIALSLWPSASKEPQTTIAVIRQEHCLNVQQAAITRFYRLLCKEKTFAKTWEAAGGATGVAQLMAKLSVSGVRSLVKWLGISGRAQGARKERQRATEELLTLLWGLDGDENAVLDSRPLRDEYVKILPACGGAFRLQWKEMKRQLPDNYDIAVETDHEFFEQHYDEKLRRNEIKASEFLTAVKPLVIYRTQYGLDVLDRFIDSETLLGASPDALLEAVIYPLSKRFLSRRMITSDTTMRFWSRVMLCLKERQPFHKEFRNSSEHYKRILVRLVKVWNDSRGRTEYSEMLTELFPLIPETVLKRHSLVDLIKDVAPTRRYQLLRLFLKHTVGFQFDIGEALSLEYSGLKKSSIRWHPELFSLLPADEAFTLWEKVQRAGKDVGYWERYPTPTSIYGCRDQDDFNLADCLIIRAYLLRQSQAIPPFTAAELDTIRSDLRQEVSRRMKKATQGRLPEIRSKWAVAALELCVAIGDLELYGETLRWARRFNKDPLTVQEIYGGYFLRTRELTDLVAFLPAKESTPVHFEELSQRIQSANDILQILFDTAMMGVNEPSFRGWSDWGNAFELINRVICKRIALVNDFQDRTKISDDALFEALWKPTFAMLEKMLPHQHIFGPAGGVRFDNRAYSSLSRFQVKDPESLREPTIRFLDQLARYHDSIWREFRLRHTPALVTADEIWPKGLTIQHLVYDFESALPYLPYGRSRIEAIVFMNPLRGLQPIQIDEETQLAIGPFIDSWAAALQQYIRMPGKLSKEPQRKERISRAWQHATINLSKDRMSPEEAERFWWSVFEGIGVKKDEVGIDEEADERPEPSLPNADEDMQPIEWNPDPEYERISQTEKSKTLTPTCLDVLLSRPKNGHLTKFISARDSEFGKVKCVIPQKPRPLSFWDSFSTTYSKLTCKHVDAYVVAGILALNMKKGSDISLLKKPLPNSEAVRIPAVYLDQEFLEREVDAHVSGFTGIIDHFKYYVPASLFSQLGASVLESIRRGPETDKPFGTLVWVINRLLEGASPSMAIPLIQQFVLENPDASSWHRPLLNPKALIHFRPADAKHFFETFTDAILDKLQEQAEKRAKQKSDDESANKGPLVKVTTVKMLAQLLRESPVVDPGLAVELNIKILKRASHVDIRTAAVKGLTEAIANTTDPEVKKRIFNALLEYAAPIASSINESQPLTDWDALSSDDELPEIWKSSDGTLTTPTIMDLVLKLGFWQDWQSEESRAYKKLIYTIMDASAENNQRWMKLFIKKHGFTMPDDAQLPAIPMFPTALETFLRVMKTDISAKYVDMAKQYLLLRMKLPDWVSAITDAVRADRKLVSSDSGRHWGYLWNHDYDRLTKSLLETIRLHLTKLEKKTNDAENHDKKTQQKDSHQSLASFLFEIADIIIMQGNLNKFDQFVSDTLTATRDNPVWGRILERIDSLRTPAWQADQNRKPAVLPDTLSLKIKMLNLSLPASNPDEIKEVAAKYAKKAVGLLHDIVASGVPYQNSYSALQRELGNAQPKALIAIMIGSTPALDNPNNVTLVDHLRVELAMMMLDSSWIFKQKGSMAPEDDVLKRAEELVMKVSRSSLENFRNLAAHLKGIIENTEGWGLFD